MVSSSKLAYSGQTPREREHARPSSKTRHNNPHASSFRSTQLPSGQIINVSRRMESEGEKSTRHHAIHFHPSVEIESYPTIFVVIQRIFRFSRVFPVPVQFTFSSPNEHEQTAFFADAQALAIR